MPLLGKFTIKQKIIVIVVSINVLTSSIVFIFNSVRQIQDYKQNIWEFVVKDARLLGDYCILPIEFNYPERVKENLDKMKTNHEYVCGAVYLSDGSLFASSCGLDSIATQITRYSEPEFIIGKKYFEVYAPIYFKGQHYGTVYLVMDNYLSQRIQTQLTFAVLIVLAVGLLSFFLALWFQQIISAPILNLARAANWVTKNNDYSVSVKKDTNDEVGRLCDSFNQMLKAVKQREEERDQAAMKLTLSEENFRNIFNYSADGILLANVQGKILEVNPSFARMLGYSYQELLGTFTVDHADEAFRKERPGIVKQLIEGKNYAFEATFIHKDGSEVPFEIHSRSIRYRNRKTILSIYRNITERKKIEKELILAKERAEESDRLKSAFLANMSHEIRTPMNGILGYAALLKQENLQKDSRERYIQVINESAQRLLYIINDIIDISKIESGIINIEKETFSINTALKSVYAFFEAPAHKKGIELIDNFSQYKGIMVFNDEAKITQIITNFLSNAIKFTHKGSVELGLEIISQRKRQIKVYVKDTGIGIPSDAIETVFDRFKQVRENGKINYGGTGLGLSISNAFAKALGGEIVLESEIGSGSTFSLLIEFSNMDEIPATDIPTSDIIPNLLGKKILIVEDEADNRDLIEELLKPTLAKLVSVSDGYKAVETVKNEPDISIILMDIKLPGMDGYQTTELIRQVRPDVLIIAQTAFALSGDKEKSLMNGCVAYLSKPILKKELYNTLQKLLGNNKKPTINIP